MTERSKSSVPQYPRQCEVVESRYFGGLSLDETAEALGISRDTVKRDWRFARLWLLRALEAPARLMTPERRARVECVCSEALEC